MMFNGWRKKFHARQAFKSKMLSIARKMDGEDILLSFRQWKKGAFFMKMCETIYRH
jgi:hypothetical protein